MDLSNPQFGTQEPNHRRGRGSDGAERLCRAGIAVALPLFLALLPASVRATQFTLSQTSDPEGVVHQETLVDGGTTTATIQAPDRDGNLRLAYWTLNGEQQRDAYGNALNPVSFLLLGPVRATAVYLDAGADGNTNRLPDWWEQRFSPTGLASAAADPDADGFANADERARDSHPKQADRIADGGFVAGSAEELILVSTNAVLLRLTSMPEGLVASDVVTNRGATVQIGEVEQTRGSHHFAYWAVNGERQADMAGRALRSLSLTLTGNVYAVAHYLPLGQDNDRDGVHDWYELAFATSTNFGPGADTDGDGFGLAVECTRDWHPGLRDRIKDGGFVAGASPDATVVADTNLVLVSVAGTTPGQMTYTFVTNRGASLTFEASVNGSDSRFAFWEIGGVRHVDSAGRGLASVSMTATGFLDVVETRVVPGEDQDRDGVDDWFELHFLGDLGNAGSSDGDGDGFTLIEELVRDYHPGLHDRVGDGGFVGGASADVLATTSESLCSYTVVSSPKGFVEMRGVTNRGAVLVLPDLWGASGGYRFARWLVNGTVVTDLLGRAMCSFSHTLVSNALFEAQYERLSADSDGDAVPDWFELHHVGSVEYDALHDGDSDGLGLALEYVRHSNPGLPDRVADGGFVVGASVDAAVDFRHFRRVQGALVDGVHELFFALGASSTGTFASAGCTAPALGDWDGDCDLDLFVGATNGTLHAFENAGSPVVPNFVERTTNFAALASAWRNVAVPAPALGDWSGDGFADLAVGGGTGGIWLVESPGSFEEDALTGALRTVLFAVPAGAVPAFGDASGDNALDLLVLLPDGRVDAYFSTGNPDNPYSSPPSWRHMLGVKVDQATGLTTADVNGDGVLDVLVSDDNGNVWEFHGVGASP